MDSNFMLFNIAGKKNKISNQDKLLKYSFQPMNSIFKKNFYVKVGFIGWAKNTLVR